MFLLDTNIWLELLLEQEKADQVRRPQPSARKLQRLPLQVTPSPGPPRLGKTPAAVHPLPQGGEG